jgi:hypothetical protein
MLEHHRAIQADSWPVRPPDESWRRRRQQYRTWLDDGAQRLYERFGFAPWSHTMLGRP